LTGTLRRSIHTEQTGKTEVKIGTNVEYAPYQEYGTYKMTARPYLRPAFDYNKQRVIDKISAVWEQLLK
jgi:HK97 gp10 family phage protein